MLSITFTTLFLRRNHKTLKECLRVLDIIDNLYKKEISEGKGYDDWRYKLYKTVDYNQVVLAFWKPIESFYDFDWHNKP